VELQSAAELGWPTAKLGATSGGRAAVNSRRPMDEGENHRFGGGGGVRLEKLLETDPLYSAANVKSSPYLGM
jgi:hypothetical protein